MLSIPAHFGPASSTNSERGSSLPSSLLNTEGQFKLLIVGGQKSGKSSLLNRFLSNEFDPKGQYDKTLGAALSIHFFTEGEHRAALALWEIGGDPSYRNALLPHFSDNVVSVILLINVNQPNSKEDAIEIYELLKKHCPTSALWIVGSQAEELSPTKSSDFLKWAQETFDTTNVKTTSAKTGEGVDDLFQDIRIKLLEPYT